jgi:hypothetical protein
MSFATLLIPLSPTAARWTFDDDGLVAESKGNYDQAEYDRRLEHGAAELQ